MVLTSSELVEIRVRQPYLVRGQKNGDYDGHDDGDDDDDEDDSNTTEQYVGRTANV